MRVSFTTHGRSTPTEAHGVFEFVQHGLLPPRDILLTTHKCSSKTLLIIRCLRAAAVSQYMLLCCVQGITSSRSRGSFKEEMGTEQWAEEKDVLNIYHAFCGSVVCAFYGWFPNGGFMMVQAQVTIYTHRWNWYAVESWLPIRYDSRARLSLLPQGILGFDPCPPPPNIMAKKKKLYFYSTFYT